MMMRRRMMMRRDGRDLLVKVNCWTESVHGESEVFV